MRDPREVIVRPVVTERSMELSTGDAGDPQYAFIVVRDANKLEIKNAVEKLFNVSVSHVNTMNYRGKARRVGRHLGKRPAYKKAIVRLKDGESIDVYEGV
jgi:large subunit ribosomal protein L23